MKISALTILFTLISFLSLSQAYHSMLADSNTWYVVHTFEGSYTELLCTRGDTVIKGLSYKILGFCEKSIINEFTYLREDSLDKKVYAIPPKSKDTTEVVYCDFNLNNGDSIFLYNVDFGGDSIGWFVVDSTFIYNSAVGPRKGMMLSGKNSFGFTEHPVWIEGIGTIGNPESPSTTPDEWANGELTCYYQDSIKIFESEYAIQFGDCMIFTGIEEEKNFPEVEVYPNPVVNILFFHSDKGLEPVQCTIYSSSGKSCLKPEIIQNGSKYFVQLESLSKGFYMVRISTTNGLFYRHFIKE